MTQRQTTPRPTIRGRFTTCEITRREDLTEDLWKIWLKPAQPFNFKPGQYCTIGAEGIERPYSIVSSPDEAEIELFVELVPPPDGNLTPVLYDLSVGTELTLRPRAKGIFVFKPEFRNHVMVGTVTGVAPYVSMLRKFLNDAEWNADASVKREDYRFYVLEGASYLDEFGYDDELSEMADAHDNIEFFGSVSRPTESRNDEWQGPIGRVNTLVEDFVNQRGLDPAETVIYACGHPGMIEDVKERYAETSYHVEEERFWKDDE
jgi:ferredoxin--NADP+ reductase